MHRRGVVPHHDVADAPLVHIGEFRLARPVFEFREEGGAFVRRQVCETYAVGRAEIERFSSELRMSSYEGVHDGRFQLALLFRQCNVLRFHRHLDREVLL